MRNILIAVTVLSMLLVSVIVFLQKGDTIESDLVKLKTSMSKTYVSSVDHSKFDILKQTFQTPQEVTKACVSCHNGRAAEVMKSNHWNWEEINYIKGRGIVYLGKKNVMNNFCLAVGTSEMVCAKCHVGLGMPDKDNDMAYSDTTNVDCLVCHDRTETYKKGDNLGGQPALGQDFNAIAQGVGKPNRANCGVCHFFGGGGNNVKHGDLEKSMFEPTKDVDVHMAVDGVNMTCIACHKTDKHNISGQLYAVSSENRDRVSCEQCHTSAPHEDRVINNHMLKVACQTCHIPEYAKVNATKTHWDWSTAGKLKDGKPFKIHDKNGNDIYMSQKGSFKWGKKLKPEYAWHDGTVDHYLQGDKIKDPSKPIVLNKLNGSYAIKDSKIYPVKVMRTKQYYDPVNKLLAVPSLFSSEKGKGALWLDFDQQKAIEVGMKEAGLPYSGKLAFIETEMYWPINHMVSSKEFTVSCEECHTKENSRIENLTDFYMPGRDQNTIVEAVGIIAVWGSLLGVIGHAFVRIFYSRKYKKMENENE